MRRVGAESGQRLTWSIMGSPECPLCWVEAHISNPAQIRPEIEAMVAREMVGAEGKVSQVDGHNRFDPR